LTNDQFAILAMEARKELARREVLESNLQFTRYFFRKKHRKYFVVGHHHKTICAALDRVISGECKRLIINCPPRYSKTELAVKNFIAKGLAMNPAAKFIHLSYSDTLALDNSEEVKDLVTDEAYAELFPEVQIKKDSKAKKKWYTTKGGGVYATGAGGQVTGFGAGRVDDDPEDDEEDPLWFDDDFLPEETEGFGGAIIIDDPIKPEEADSEIVRERINNRFDSTIRNRTNSRNTPIIVIMQRLHPMDLSGYLMEVEPDEWEVISLPAIQPDGTALWEHKHTLQELQKLKGINPVVFERQYMQNPQPAEGLLFPASLLHYFSPDQLDESEYKYMAVDPADTGGDDTSAPLGELFGDGIFITDVVYNKSGTDVNIPAIVEKIVSKKVDYTEIESNAAWAMFTKQVREKVLNRDRNRQIRAIVSTGNKQARILAQSAFIINNFYFLKEQYWTPQYRAFMKNLTAYLMEGTNKHDDAPDSLAMMAVYYQKTFRDLW
jgi:predicted phage terminase large subunit-like protein